MRRDSRYMVSAAVAAVIVLVCLSDWSPGVGVVLWGLRALPVAAAVILAALPYVYRQTHRGLLYLQAYNVAVNLIVGLMLMGFLAIASFVGMGVGYSILSICDATEEPQYGWTVMEPIAGCLLLGFYLLLFIRLGFG